MGKEWFARIAGEVIGPMEADELRLMAQSKRITVGDEVRRGIDGKWNTAGEVNGLFPKEPESSQPKYRRRPMPTKASKEAAIPLYLWFAIAGVVMSVVGVFAPVAGGPLGLTVNYLNNGKGHGVFVAVAAVLSGIAVAFNGYVLLWLTSAFQFGVLSFSIGRFIRVLSVAGDENTATQLFQLQWGWSVLYLGAAATIAAPAMKDNSAAKAIAIAVAAILLGVMIGRFS